METFGTVLTRKEIKTVARAIVELMDIEVRNYNNKLPEFDKKAAKQDPEYQKYEGFRKFVENLSDTFSKELQTSMLANLPEELRKYDSG